MWRSQVIRCPLEGPSVPVPLPHLSPSPLSLPQVIRCLLEGPEGEGDATSLVLLFQNRTEEDVLLRDVLDGASPI